MVGGSGEAKADPAGGVGEDARPDMVAGEAGLQGGGIGRVVEAEEGGAADHGQIEARIEACGIGGKAAAGLGGPILVV